MNFLLDTNTISYFIKGNRGVASRFSQFRFGVAASTITVAELYAGSYRKNAPANLLTKIQNVLAEVEILSFDEAVARTYGKVNADLLDNGRKVPAADAFIAATALHHNLTLVTHNTRDFMYVPDLRLADWIE